MTTIEKQIILEKYAGAAIAYGYYSAQYDYEPNEETKLAMQELSYQIKVIADILNSLKIELNKENTLSNLYHEGRKLFFDYI